MHEVPLSGSGWSLTIPAALFDRLMTHLFPGDGDEHGAVIAAGVAAMPDGRVRLLARELYPARDGVDYLPGQRGYRMLDARFVTERVLDCSAERLAYLAVHNHGGRDRVAFSSDDMASHERGYPALLDIAAGMPVGALVFARNAVAGDIWLPDGRRAVLDHATVVGRSRRVLRAEPARPAGAAGHLFDRQARLFGAVGQQALSRAKVAIVGLGGVGSVLAELLGRLGVGTFVLIDPDRAEPSNLPRLLGARRLDALPWLSEEGRPAWLRRVAARLSARKVDLARRAIRRANPEAAVEAVFDDFCTKSNAARLVGCDYVFLAADTMTARLVFNNLVHQYLIPGVQIGSKVVVDPATGDVQDVFAVVRPVTPDLGCLWCNGLISPAELQREAIGEAERAAQRYGLGEDAPAPSVVTLNAVGAAHAVDDFLFHLTGMTGSDARSGYLRSRPVERGIVFDNPRRDPHCPECGVHAASRLGRGDAVPMMARA